LSIDRRVHHQQNNSPRLFPHLVPQVVEVVGPIQQQHRSKQQQQSGQVSRTNSCSTEVLPTSGATAGRPAPPPVGGCNNGVKSNRCNSNSTATLSNNVSSLRIGGLNHQPIESSLVASIVSSNKPILSRKNWNNTIDVSGVGGGSSSSAHHLQHQPSCLRRYGSQQSCKSATTLRSYVSSTSRGTYISNDFIPHAKVTYCFSCPMGATSLGSSSIVCFFFTAHHHLYMCGYLSISHFGLSSSLYYIKKKRRANLRKKKKNGGLGEE